MTEEQEQQQIRENYRTALLAASNVVQSTGPNQSIDSAANEVQAIANRLLTWLR